MPKKKTGAKPGTKSSPKLTIVVPIPVKNRGAKRGRPKGTDLSYLDSWKYQKGHLPAPGAGRPLGRKNQSTLLSQAYKAVLEDEAPDYLKEYLGVTGPCTYADIVGVGMARRAAIEDTTAAKELREVTEGRLPDTLNLEGHINYSAGKSAKDVLLSKLDTKLEAPNPEAIPEPKEEEEPPSEPQG